MSLNRVGRYETDGLHNILVTILFVSMMPIIGVVGEIKTAILKVDGMTCNLCVPAVKKALMKIDGVKRPVCATEE